MYDQMEHELARARREEMLREARLHRLAKIARRGAKRGRKKDLAWELRRYGGRLRKLFRSP